MAYAGLTAAALGHRVGLVTAAADSLDLTPLTGIQLARQTSPKSTSFENRHGPQGRTQILHSRAGALGIADVPHEWLSPAVVHLAPIAGEIDLALARAFDRGFVGLTPQGLMRRWELGGRVSILSWEHCQDFLPLAHAVVLSIEDLAGDWSAAEAMAMHCRVLAVTDGAGGARLYRDEQGSSHAAPPTAGLDPTGAGDVFAAVFFSLLQRTGDPELAVRAANRVASLSVTRIGLTGVPTPAEAQAAIQPLKA